MRTLFLFCALLALCSYKPGTQKWLLVIHSDEANITNNQLQLGGQGGMVAAFKNEGGSEAKAIAISQLIKNWNTLFHNAPPNAIIIFKEASKKFEEHIVVLQAPTMVSGKLTFQILEMGTPLQGSYGESLLFIDASVPVNEPSLNLFNNEVEAVQTPKY